jgi:hypothetical protein
MYNAFIKQIYLYLPGAVLQPNKITCLDENSYQKKPKELLQDPEVVGCCRICL